MKRLRLYDIRRSRLHKTLGICQDNVTELAEYVNAAEERLLYADEAGDEGWYGTFAEVAFTVERDKPYITLPRRMARLEFVTICDSPVQVNNQFGEYLNLGNGRMPKRFAGSCARNHFLKSIYSRNNAVTSTDLTNGPQGIRVYPRDPADAEGTKRILIQGLDGNSRTIYSTDNQNQVQGVFLTIGSPSGDSPTTFTSITAIQKDVTHGDVEIYQVDPDTGEEVLLLVMEASETTANYRRYYFDSIPCGCCPEAAVPGGTCTTVQVTAIVKLEPIPVRVDTDYLLIQSEEAIIQECQAIYYEGSDIANAKPLSVGHHKQAVRMLNGQLGHYLGKDQPAVSVKPFGTADLRLLKVGSIT